MYTKSILSLLAVIAFSLNAHAAMYDDSNDASDATVQGTTHGMEDDALESDSATATDADDMAIENESATHATSPVVETVKPQRLAPEAKRSVSGATSNTAPVAPVDASRVHENESPQVAVLRGPSPKVLDPNRRGYFQLGVGPAYGAGLQSDSLMYNIVGSYNFNLSDSWTAKAISDISLATGSVSSSIYNFAVGGEYYMNDFELIGGATPYLAADVGLAFARNAIEQTTNGAALGAGAGFKFQASQMNFDINAHYEQLTAQAGDAAPAIFALRGSVMF